MLSPRALITLIDMNEELLYRYLKCETAPSEEEALLDWLEASPENRCRLETAQLTMEGLALYPQTLDGRMFPEQTVKKDKNPRMPLLARIASWSSAAAAVVAVAAGAGYGIASRKMAGWSAQEVVVEAPAGQRTSMTLSDGTLVWLNSGTRLEYPAVFAKNERRVKLSGEAAFDVKHDKSRPFIVETFACKAEVLGTKFNICAEPARSHFSAALFEGRLRISRNDIDNASITLSPDETVELENGRLLHGTISDRDSYLWVDGVLSLDNLTFEEAMRKFEMYYGINVVIERKELPRVRYRGKIRVSDGVDYALGLLMSTSEFTYEKSYDRNTIYIR